MNTDMSSYRRCGPAIIASIILIVVLIFEIYLASQTPSDVRSSVWIVVIFTLIIGLIMIWAFWYLCKNGNTDVAWVLFVLAVVIPIIYIIGSFLLAKDLVSTLRDLSTQKRNQLVTQISDRINELPGADNLRQFATRL